MVPIAKIVLNSLGFVLAYILIGFVAFSGDVFFGSMNLSFFAWTPEQAFTFGIVGAITVMAVSVAKEFVDLMRFEFEKE